MLVRQRPLSAAILLALFITVCLGWMFHGIGRPVPWWGYPLVFGVFAGWLYTIGCMLLRADRHGGRVRSSDLSIEEQ